MSDSIGKTSTLRCLTACKGEVSVSAVWGGDRRGGHGLAWRMWMSAGVETVMPMS